MGFVRSIQRQALSRAEVEATVISFLVERDIAVLVRESDPFAIENSCSHPMGHFPIRDRSEIVCAHCSKVFWR